MKALVLALVVVPLAACSTRSVPIATKASADDCAHEEAAATGCCQPGEKRADGDWCEEHGLPESECVTCNPSLANAVAAVAPPPNADIKLLSENGEDVPKLEEHLVAGKVTIFDFYADWCAPCKQIDSHINGVLAKREDVAYRRLNVVSWNSALSKRYMAKIGKLPYVVVYGKDGRLVKKVTGLDLKGLDKAIEDGATR